LSSSETAWGSSSLGRALDLLEVIADGPEEGMTASQLANATGMNRVTVHRTLATFKSRALVRQAQPRAPYRLGFRLLELAERVVTELELARTGKPILEELCRQSGETCHLGVLDGTEIVYVAKMESPQAMRLVSRVGSRVPLHSTALGKAILATMDWVEAEKLLASTDLVPRTDSTLVTLPDLQADLGAIQARNYAIDFAENEAGVNCVACAIPSPLSRPAAAVSISGPSGRVPESRFPELGRLAVSAAAKLADSLQGGSAETKRGDVK
jgi:DNA-binding IclR family transcriptional regulator